MSFVERHARAVAVLLLVVGFLFRAWAVGHARFTGDESYFWATARNTATLDARPVYGPAMTGSQAYHPGPIFYYLMAIPQRVHASPWAGGLFVAALHALSSALLGLLAYRARGARAAIIALALVAFAPWDVLYADRIWLSCVAPVWGAIILYAATRLERPGAQTALVFFALTCPQLHMSAPVVWAAALALALPLRAKLSPRAIAVGLALTLLAYAIPLHYELTHELANTRAILSQGGGKEPLDVVLKTPLRVLGYAVLSGTSEIGYHFETGYWRTFEEGAAYFSAEGLARWWSRHGALWGPLTILSVALASWAWGAASWRARRRDAEANERDLEARVLRAIGLGLVVATALMMAAKKPYFPHYTNLLMPALLWPLVTSLDRLRRGALIPAAVALSMLAMASSSARYYLEVDRLNGLTATVSMVDEVMAGEAPFSLHFDGFQNRFAWEMLASTGHKRSLPVGEPAKLRYRVKNGAIAPPGEGVHDGVRLEVGR